jgi:TPR repeat protein
MSMRCVFAAVAVLGLALLLQPSSVWSAPPIDLDTIIEGETPEQLCDRLAVDPLVGFGPDEWAGPFTSIDPYRAVPACVKAMKANPAERRFVLQAGLAFLAAKKNEAAKKLLDRLISENNPSDMLALAYPEAEAAELMRRAAEQGSPTGMMLLGMTQITGKGVPKDEIEGVRMVRRAVDSGSTRAMLIMANFHHQGLFGVGYDPAKANRLVAEAAKLGDPRAKDMLASLSAAPKE